MEMQGGLPYSEKKREFLEYDMLMSYYEGYDGGALHTKSLFLSGPGELPARLIPCTGIECGPHCGNGDKEDNAMENNTKQELKICQSCGMPMQEDQYGTNGDGSRNEKYCCYCYKDGAFVQDCTLEEMIDSCASFEVEDGRAKSLEEAKGMLREYFPTLERWRA